MRGANDNTTSFNVPWLVEMYANFGSTGVIVGMLLVGLLFAYCDGKFNRPGITMLELMAGTALLFDLFDQESNFSLMVGSKILFWIVLYTALNIMLKDSKVPDSWSQVSGGGQARALKVANVEAVA